jgi:hypothetical protein
MEVYYTPKVNTQLLITVSNFSRILAHVQLLLVLEHNPQITLRTQWVRPMSSRSRTQLLIPILLWKRVCYIVVWNAGVFIVIGKRLFSLLRYYGTVTTLHYQLLQQRWHYWVKGTSHMQHHRGNPVCHSMFICYFNGNQTFWNSETQLKFCK